MLLVKRLKTPKTEITKQNDATEGGFEVQSIHARELTYHAHSDWCVPRRFGGFYHQEQHRRLDET